MFKILKIVATTAIAMLALQSVSAMAQDKVGESKADRLTQQSPTPEHLARVIFNASKSKEFYASAQKRDADAITKLLAANGLKKPIKVVIDQQTPNANGQYCTWVPIWYWTSWPNTGYMQLWLVCSNDGGAGWQTE